MKKSFITAGGLAFLSFIASRASAQTLIDRNTASDFTAKVGAAAQFTPVSLGTVVAVVIQAALGLLAMIFVILTIVSGFRWMTAGGNEENIKKAQDTIRASLIGLVIILAAWGITWYIFTYLPFNGGSSMGPAA